MLMFILKRILRALLLSLLPLILFLLALDFAVLRVAGNPEPVKETLKESGLYTSAIDTFLVSTDNPNKDTSGDISTDNPVVQAAFKKAFPPELIESSTENFIDSIYKWMRGDTAIPDFRIDLTQAKTTFVEEVAAGAETRAANLPACPRGQIEFNDPFSATCLPRGASPSLAAEKIRSELGNNESFLSNPVLTASSIKSSESPEKSVFTDSNLPSVYQGLQNGRLVLLILALLAVTGVVLLSNSLRAGIRHAGIVLLVVGVGILIASFISNKAVTEALPDLLARSENAALADKLQSLMANIVRDTNRTFSAFGWAYTITGTGAILGSLFVNMNKKIEAGGNTADKSSSPKPDSKDSSRKA